MTRFSYWLQKALRNPGGVLSFFIMLPTNFKLISQLMRDPRVGLLPKLLFLASLVYLISPLDLVPDFIIPILGWGDDLVIVIAAARFLINAAPGEVVQEHLRQIRMR